MPSSHVPEVAPGRAAAVLLQAGRPALDEPGCISFATFATLYEDRFSRWFAKFAADLEAPSSPASDRLSNLHCVMVWLVRELDVDRTLVEFDKSGELVNLRWARATTLGAPTRHSDPFDQAIRTGTPP
jgi:hypothetical protein